MTSLFLENINSKSVLVSDGATGTNLQKRGLEKGQPAEKWVLDRSEEIKKLYQDFVNAGSDIILSCTFGASLLRLEQHGLADSFQTTNQSAVNLAKEVIVDSGSDVMVAGSMGPLGQLMAPLGLLTEKDAFSAYASQAKVLSESGVDVLLVETQFDLNEAHTAVKACQEVSDLPIICSFSFDRGTRTMMGVKPEQFAEDMAELGIAMVGINCGRSLEENVRVLESISLASSLPIWFKPNAGLPSVDSDGNSVYSITPEEMGQAALDWVKLGAKIVGGCCGSTPDHIKSIAQAVKHAN